MNYLILSVDTSCDETSAAVTAEDRVLANIISSQIPIHRKWGGVVPSLAKRMHQKMINPVIKQALEEGKIKIESIDALAVTQGPGLAPALEIGIKKIKELWQIYKKPVISVNHMEGHLLSSFAKNRLGNGPFSKTKPQFPILGLLASGGHTQLVLMKNFGDYQLLGETLDDAVGEAFDKVAKMLDLGYPGGPIISELAGKGKPKFELPIPMQKSPNLNFSFSGLKTACLYKLRVLKKEKKKFNKKFYYDFAASFEKAVIKALIIKLDKAIKKYQPKQIVLGGGVISNQKLRQACHREVAKYGLKLFVPYSKRLFTDNAAMIGVCAWYKAKRGEFIKNPSKLERLPNLNFQTTTLPRC